MALGNWTNTPSPANDPNAPTAVGNEGSVILKFDGEDLDFAIQSAELVKCQDGGQLILTGESVGDKPSLHLAFKISDPSAAPKGILAVANEPSSQFFAASAGKHIDISGGSLEVIAVTGSGPWELDGELRLETSIDTAEGEAKVQIISA